MLPACVRCAADARGVAHYRGQDRLPGAPSPHGAGQEQVQHAQVPPGRALHAPRHHLPDRVRDHRGRHLRVRCVLARAATLRSQYWPYFLRCGVLHRTAHRAPRAGQVRPGRAVRGLHGA
eukprot:scaffold932_cov299-Prasinococcus_capsulatus_cf.AAC.7